MIILPDAYPARCPRCDQDETPEITPIYVHDEDEDGAGCAHYVCWTCSSERGPSGRWHAWTTPVPLSDGEAA